MESTQPTGPKKNWKGRWAGDDDLVIRTELVGGVGKYGRLLGWLYLGDGTVSLNEQMIEEGYAWHMTEEPNRKTLGNSVRFVEHMEL